MLDFDGSYAMAKQFVKVRRIVSRGSFALVVGILAVTTAALASAAPGASTVPPVYAAAPAEVNPPASPAAPGTPAAPAAPGQAEEVAPIPPEVEEAPVAATSGGYCFAGPHPADTRVAAGPAWDETQSNHIHNYPPFDLRLFRLQNGCYHFIGDPSDFGYRGQTYQYYGAHPVMAGHGGGWCFMIGGHAHWWRPWSSLFVVAGPWYYWHGPYDPFFWNHWPYYAVYYRHHYPSYYRGGRFARGGWHGEGRGHAVAPAIGHVARPVGAARGQWAAPSAATRSFGQQDRGWNQPNRGWGQAQPQGAGPGGNSGWRGQSGSWGRSGGQGAVTPSPAPSRWDRNVTPSGNGNGSSGRSSFGRSEGWGTARPMPAAPSRTFTAPAPSNGGGSSYRGGSGGGTFRGGSPAAPSGGGRSGGWRSR